jgi:hypothetical protein
MPSDDDYTYSDDDDHGKREDDKIPAKAVGFCSRCESIKFDDVKFGGYSNINWDTAQICLKLSSDNRRVISNGPHATGIGDYTSLQTGCSFEDNYPELPDLRSRAEYCDFCRFLRAGLRSEEVRLSISDQCADLDLDDESFQIGVSLQYSWEPARGSKRVGLDALYVFVICLNSRRSSRYEIPDLKGMLCHIRYSVSADGKTFNLRKPILMLTKLDTHAYDLDAGNWLRLRHSPGRNWDSSAISWARHQYTSCSNGDSNHEYCRRTWERMDAERASYQINGESAPVLPYRLIDVQARPPRIVYPQAERDQKDLDWIPKYVALSYCWGGKNAEQLKLSRAYLSQLMKKIPWEGLSAAQKDAITATRDLGFKYLWNDALCICQDDSDDWETEAGRMGMIYQYAACTITSLRSSFDQKFLNPTVPEITLPYKSSIRDISARFKLRLDGVENRLCGSGLMDKLGESLPSNRWVTRGWAFQEQNNSLRMFLFWPGGIQYNCPCSSTQYSGYYSSDEDPVRQNYWLSRDPDGGEDPILDEDTFKNSHTVVKDIYGSSRWRREYLYFTWLRFATDYSHRVFTKQIDTFPALWGPGREYKRRLGDEYLMGIWKGDLWGFLWRLGSNDADPPHGYLSLLRADFNSPDSGTIRALCSWSWVGNHRIKFLNQTGEMGDDLVDFRPECTISLSEFNARENDHSKGYDSTILKFRTKRTKPVSGFYNPELGRFGNEVTVPVRFPEAKVFCALDWRNVKEGIDDDGIFNFDSMGVKTTFLLLASAAVKGRSDGCRAALGLVLMEARNARDYEEKIWYRCGVFVAKPPDGWVGQQRGGLKIFDEYDEKTTWVK